MSYLCAVGEVLILQNRKAKLRKQEPITLGKQYAGSRVSRDALEAESDDDPFAKRTDDQSSDEELMSNPDDEDDSDDPTHGVGVGSDDPLDDEKSDAYRRGKMTGKSGSSSRAQPKSALKNEKALLSTQRQQPGRKLSKELPELDLIDMASSSDGSESGLGEDGASGSELDETNSEMAASDDISDDEDESEDVDEDDESLESGSDDEPGVGVRKQASKKMDGVVKNASAGRKQGDDREELKRLMASDQKTIAATISQAAKADAAKGKAVKEQRTTFDALLNTRIKLQKGLSAINEIAVVTGMGGDGDTAERGSDEDEAANSEAIKSAENAALALWSTLEELRTALANAQTKDGSNKRKAPGPITDSTSTASLWERMSDLETESLIHRRAILDKWSAKARGASASASNTRGKLLGSASGTQSITAVLDAHVATEIGNHPSKRARQASVPNGSNSGESIEPIYDDTAFYQALLRDLVEQRMSSEVMTGGLDNLHQLPSRLPIHPITGMRNDKNRKEVDTRASKGRKMRFNVHEKLQNFMAPEDRGSWTVRARDEFFASLLGKTASGLLGERDESGSDMDSDEDREEGGLRLFRN
ncbi:Protein bfr2 [Penicillium macrosclerotiorum]|uniref:Protein bfr2 n=1 Tax=Penicillium macrosclerotiorum TaxID=303699 RepID=UPI002547CDA2|nr:Protein bfr2 [Penicillium macrosclerotiorum]KAJ5666644.1 Protein bfr2 [Penicillium macrosclerotiorum]